MPHRQRPGDSHAAALLAVELDNRAFRARSVPDRGDDYVTTVAARHAVLLAEQGVRHVCELTTAVPRSTGAR